jgi:hypothetical protein
MSAHWPVNKCNRLISETDFRFARRTSAMANGKQGKARSADRSRTIIRGGSFYREWLCSAGQSGSERIPGATVHLRLLAFNSGIISSACLFILSRKPISYCRFKRIDVYIL